MKCVTPWAYEVFMIQNHQISEIFCFLQMQHFFTTYTCIGYNEVSSFFVSLFSCVVNARNFVLTFLHSRIRLHYNHCIRSKAIIQPEEPDTTLHLHCLMLAFFIFQPWFPKRILTFWNFVHVYIFVEHFMKRCHCISKTFLHMTLRLLNTAKYPPIDTVFSELIRYAIGNTACQLHVKNSWECNQWLYCWSEKLVVLMVIRSQRKILLTYCDTQ